MISIKKIKITFDHRKYICHEIHHFQLITTQQQQNIMFPLKNITSNIHKCVIASTPKRHKPLRTSKSLEKVSKIKV